MIDKADFVFAPKGAYDLANQVQYFGDWLKLHKKPETVAMAFPVEGWKGSAVVTLWQEADKQLGGSVYSSSAIAEKAQLQAQSSLSLDVAGEKWPEVGARDPVIGALQEKYGPLRPALFYSPYEAAAAFIIGHRITIKQRRMLMERLSVDFGEKMEVDGQTFHAFPLPQALMEIKTYQGLSPLKIERLHGVAHSALGGLLDRESLRQLPVDFALKQLRGISGVGPFFAQGILHRGAGLVDEVTNDDMTQYAVQHAYKLAKPPSSAQVLEIAQAWVPFRMWATVLLHLWVRRELGPPKSRNS